MLMSQNEPMLMEVVMDSSIISENNIHSHVLDISAFIIWKHKVITALKNFTFISICVLIAVCHNPQLHVTSLIGVVCSVYIVITV